MPKKPKKSKKHRAIKAKKQRRKAYRDTAQMAVNRPVTQEVPVPNVRSAHEEALQNVSTLKSMVNASLRTLKYLKEDHDSIVKRIRLIEMEIVNKRDDLNTALIEFAATPFEE